MTPISTTSRTKAAGRTAGRKRVRPGTGPAGERGGTARSPPAVAPDPAPPIGDVAGLVRPTVTVHAHEVGEWAALAALVGIRLSPADDDVGVSESGHQRRQPPR